MMVFVLAFTMNRILTYHLVNLKLFSRPHYIHRSATCSVVAATCSRRLVGVSGLDVVSLRVYYNAVWVTGLVTSFYTGARD